MRNRPLWTMFATFAILFFSSLAIGDDSSFETHPQFDCQKDESRSGDVAELQLLQLSMGNTEFAFDLYKKLSEKDGNLFFSPHSISMALAMTYAGARNNTERQMADVLKYTLPQSELHSSFNALEKEIASRGECKKTSEGKEFRLNIANSIWGQKDFSFKEDFLNTLEDNYNAGFSLLDFLADPESSRITINDWISEETEEKIKDLIPPGAINESTRLVLANAIYFNAAWANSFKEKYTEKGPFSLLDGERINVDMMKNNSRYGYTDGDGYEAVELPYYGHELSMVILLPDFGRFELFEDSLSIEGVKTILSKIAMKEVVLTMPKFKYDSDFSLASTLADLGMPVAFKPSDEPERCDDPEYFNDNVADFSGMDGTHCLYISAVFHKAFILVNEAGTEAAAATAVIIATVTSVPPPPIEVNINRPFIFLIRDIETGAILFMGRVLKPVL